MIGAAQRQRVSPLLAIMTFGFVNIGGLWRLCAIAIGCLSVAEATAFDPKKPVHRTAAFLLILGFVMLAGINLTDEMVSGSEDSAVVFSDVVVEMLGTGALHLAVAFLGVGWVMRRRLPDVLRRLCLRVPTLPQVAISIAAGIGLWMLSTAVVAVWEQTVPADVFAKQTEEARQLSEAFSASLVTALLLAVVPAVSEEIFFRGAMQPVFGLFLTSLFFTAIHLQYGLTPALFILFAVSLGFSWLRLRFHTSAAIIAHAVFNFLPYLAGT